MARSDGDLVRDTLGGKRDAFGDLVERYTGLVHGVILHKVRRPDEVEDLVQDVFCKAYEELGNLREPGKFAPWLARMALNKAQAWLRQLQTQRTYMHTEPALEESVDGRRRPDQKLEAYETKGIVWEALDRLPPEYRQVLLLYHFENCRQQDIARFLNITLTTVKWRLLQSRQRLKRKLGEVFALEGRRPVHNERSMREKVLAGLPLAALIRSVPQRTWGTEWWFAWGYRRLLPLASALSLGLLGSLFYEADAEADQGPSTAPDPPGRIHVRLESISTIVRKGEQGIRIYPPCSTARFRRAVEN